MGKRVGIKSARPVIKPSVNGNGSTISFEGVREIAAKGLHLGLGVGAEIIANLQEFDINEMRKNLRRQLNQFVNRAMVKGEKIEREQRKRLAGFERQQRNRIETFLADYR
jgi:hypothetical protein